MTAHPRRVIRPMIAAVIAIIAASCAAPAERVRQPGREPAPHRAPVVAPINAHPLTSPTTVPLTGLLDGMPVGTVAGFDGTLPPVAVMIDNAGPARPQYGLAEAELVEEALVEAGITRFLAFYWRNDAPRIEPVRSARTPYLSMALELDAVYAHVGAAAEEGPADAEAQMRAWGVRSVEEETAGGAISRDPARAAPHNAMTSTGALRAVARRRGWAAPAADVSWLFKTEGAATTVGSPAGTIDIDFDRDAINGGTFAVRWNYDATTNAYQRSEGGVPHVDAASGRTLTARNVLLQFVPVRSAGDRAGHVLYDGEGTGRALALLDGVAVEATWRKDGRAGRTRYFDASGRELRLNRGTTWVEMLPAGVTPVMT